MKLVKILAAGLLGLVLVGGVAVWLMSRQLTPDIAVGTPAPDVTLTTLEGEPFAVSSFAGDLVLLDFWGST